MADMSIWANALRPPKSVADYDAEAQASQLNALQLQQGRMKADEYTRGVQEAGTIRHALTGATTDEDRIARLKGTGLPGGFAQADALQKAIIEQRKGNAAAGKDEQQAAGYKLDQSIKAHEFHVQQLANVNDPQTAMAWAQEGLQRGVFTPEQYQRGVQALQQASQSPQTFMQWKQQALQGGASATEQLKMQAEQVKQAEAVRQFGITSKEVARGHDLTYKATTRGQDMTDARSRELAEIARDAAKDKAAAKPLPGAVVKQLTEARDNAATIDRLSASFKPEFAGKGILGLGADMQLSASGNLGVDKDAVEWWKNYRKQAELVERHALFGAALTPGEQASWRSADIGPGMDKDVIARNLATRTTLAKKVLENTQQDMIDAGHSGERITAISSRNTALTPTAAPGAPAKVTNDAEYKALPSGAEYIAPDGSHRRKK